MRRSTLRLYRRQVSSMDKRKPLRIDNSFSPDFMEFICQTSHVSRGAACCASILPRQEKNGGKHNKYIRYIIDCYWIVWNVVMRRSTLRLYRRQASFMDKRKPFRIENSFSPDFMEFICQTYHVSRGAACCASIPKQQEKTAENTINIFVILLIIIGLCGMPL